MRARWRGRLAGLAIPAMVAALVPMLLTAAAARTDPTLVVRGPDDRVLARVRLPDHGFALRYRNSVYRSLAEERYVVDPSGSIRLVELGADELGVLEEYYAIDDPAWPSDGASSRRWMADPAREVTVESLIVAGTDLGRRTLLVDGAPPLELWRFVEDGEPSVVLDVSLP